MSNDGLSVLDRIRGRKLWKRENLIDKPTKLYDATIGHSKNANTSL